MQEDYKDILELLLDKSGDVMICLGADNAVVEFNSVAESVLKLDREQVLGRDFFAICQENGIALPFTTALIKNTGSRKTGHLDGHIVYKKQQSHLIRWKCLSSLSNRNPYTLILGKDISELIGYKNDSEINKLHLKNIIENLPEYIYWKDKNRVYQGCNRHVANFLGLQSPQDVIGKTDHDFEWEKDRIEKLHQIDSDVLLHGKKVTLEDLIPKPDGTERIMLTSKSPLYNETNEIIGILGVSVDITEQKIMERNLSLAKNKAEAANNAKTEFLENMRHDIRTPLTGIIGFSNIIKHEKDSKKISEYADNLISSSQALLEFLNDILDTIRLTSGELPMLTKNFNLKEKISMIIKLNQPKALEKNLSLTFQHDENIPTHLIGDSKRIHRIVLELVANALNFTEKGHVRVSTELAKKNNLDIVIKIVVKDTGIGIAKDKQEAIFARFKRLTPAYEGVYKGVGLGLAVVQQFIDDLGAEIYVTSQPHIGSLFTCVIPLKQALLDEKFDSDESLDNSITTAVPANTDINPTPPLIKSESLSQKRILLVEDQLLAAKIAESILSDLQCKVDISPNGIHAVEQAQKYPYNLIFLDIGLPDIDGFEVAKRIRANEIETNRVPIVALTAHLDTENKNQCLESGMDDVLSKPLELEIAEKMLNFYISTNSVHSKVRGS